MILVKNLVKIDVDIKKISDIVEILGPNDKYLKLLGKLFNCELYTNNSDIMIKTENQEVIEKIKAVFEILIELIKNNIVYNDRDIIYIHNIVLEVPKEEILYLFLGRKEIIKTLTGKPVYPKTINQKKYVDAIDKNTLVFGIGPAGTGKTYLAVLIALKRLKDGNVSKIILTRPAVEAGEKLGFLPGDLKEKVDPYLRPLYDAMYEILGVKRVTELIEKGVIEIAPLAYMRGRTLENAFVILDEAQNTTTPQIKLFLTRLGFGSTMVVNGDITQSDLPDKVLSGLVKASYILKNVDSIVIHYFSEIDVVRHPLVQTIIKRFEHA